MIWSESGGAGNFAFRSPVSKDFGHSKAVSPALSDDVSMASSKRGQGNAAMVSNSRVIMYILSKSIL